MPDSVATAIHESGHTIACLLLGHVPDAIVATRSDGFVRLPDGIPPDHLAIIAAAGAVAERLLLRDDRAAPSQEDCFIRNTASAELLGSAQPSFARWAESRAFELLGVHESELIALSNVILKSPRLDRDDLRAACSPLNSPLRKFYSLFPAPSRRTAAAAAWSPAMRPRVDPAIESAVRRACRRFGYRGP